jgi:hypothetical protein
MKIAPADSLFLIRKVAKDCGYEQVLNRVCFENRKRFDELMFSEDVIPTLSEVQRAAQLLGKRLYLVLE